MNKFFVFFVIVAVLAANSVKNFLLRAFPAPWYIEGFYRLIPLIFFVVFIFYALTKSMNQYHKDNSVISPLLEEDFDQPLFFEVVGTLYDETIVEIHSAYFDKDGFASHENPRLRKISEPPPFEKGYITLRRKFSLGTPIRVTFEEFRLPT